MSLASLCNEFLTSVIVFIPHLVMHAMVCRQKGKEAEEDKAIQLRPVTQTMGVSSACKQDNSQVFAFRIAMLFHASWTEEGCEVVINS